MVIITIGIIIIYRNLSSQEGSLQFCPTLKVLCNLKKSGESLRVGQGLKFSAAHCQGAQGKERVIRGTLET